MHDGMLGMDPNIPQHKYGHIASYILTDVLGQVGDQMMAGKGL